MARYEIWLCNDYGTRIADLWGHTMLDRVESFTATRVANDIGTFTAQVPTSFDPTLLRRDLIIEVMRGPDAGGLKLFRPYFLRSWTYTTKRGKQTLELHGVCANDLLRRRVVRAAPGTPAGNVGGIGDPGGGPADDVLKFVVDRSQDDSSGYGFPAPSYGSRAFQQFSIEAYAGAGPGIDPLDISYTYLMGRNGGGALLEIVEAAASEGTDLYFDVVPDVLTGEALSFIFRTRIDQPGMDITDIGVLFSQDRGNLLDCSLSYDYTQEENYIWGVKEAGPYNTKVQQRWSKRNINASIWNRCEGTTDRTAMGTAPYQRSKRGKVRFTGTITDVAGMRYGIDWNWGDRVRVRYLNFQFNAIIKALTFSVDKSGREKIGARLEYEANA